MATNSLTPLTHAPLGLIGAPLAGLYGIGVLARRLAYDKGWLQSFEPPCFTVSVGGLEAGGSGKTPVAGAIVSRFQHSGRRPGLLTRGYGRETRGLVVRQQGEVADPARIGDEPAMLVHQGIDVPIAACVDRYEGARALAALGCDALVLDDGFVHRRLKRHVDIVVLRAACPLGNGHLLPWGSLREPPSSLARAHIVWTHAGHEGVNFDAAIVERWAPHALHVQSRYRTTRVVNQHGDKVDIRQAKLVACAGIANPASFKATVQALGGRIAFAQAYADHHRYTRADVDALEALMLQHDADALVVTAKDAVKLLPLWERGELWIVHNDVEILQGANELDAILGLIRP